MCVIWNTYSYIGYSYKPKLPESISCPALIFSRWIWLHCNLILLNPDQSSSIFSFCEDFPSTSSSHLKVLVAYTHGLTQFEPQQLEHGGPAWGTQNLNKRPHFCHSEILLVLSREWMGMGLAGMIITSDHGSFSHSLLSTSKKCCFRLSGWWF